MLLASEVRPTGWTVPLICEVRSKFGGLIQTQTGVPSVRIRIVQTEWKNQTMSVELGCVCISVPQLFTRRGRIPPSLPTGLCS